MLANPQILTLNNEEAEINVSQVIPVSSKVVTNINNQTTTEFEFKDVGIILKIKPTITGDDRVRLAINQESSSVAERPPWTVPAGFRCAAVGSAVMATRPCEASTMS